MGVLELSMIVVCWCDIYMTAQGGEPKSNDVTVGPELYPIWCYYILFCPRDISDLSCPDVVEWVENAIGTTTNNFMVDKSLFEGHNDYIDNISCRVWLHSAGQDSSSSCLHIMKYVSIFPATQSCELKQ